jgi:hypothetical protein
MKLTDFAENSEKNNRAIQMALRETDASVLAEYLAGEPTEDRDIVYRNMSERACRLLMDDVVELEGNVAATQHRRAEQFFLQRLSRFLNYASRDMEPLPADPPVLDLSTDESLVASLLLVSRYERAKGTLSLDEMIATVDHPIARKGLQMTIDGWDAVEKSAILERMKETYLASVSHTIDILIAGIECLGGDDHPLVIEERLKAFLPSSVRG